MPAARQRHEPRAGSAAFPYTGANCEFVTGRVLPCLCICTFSFPYAETQVVHFATISEKDVFEYLAELIS